MEAAMSAVIGGGFEEFAAAFGLNYRNMSPVIGGIQKRFETVRGQEVLVMSLVIGGEMRTSGYVRSVLTHDILWNKSR